jgi:hypothetical protein
MLAVKIRKCQVSSRSINPYIEYTFCTGPYQRHRDRRPSTTACRGCCAMGTNKVKKSAVRKIIFCTVLTKAAKAGQNYIVWARTSPTNELRKDPFYMYSKISQFNNQHGPPPSVVSLEIWIILKSGGTVQRSFGRKVQQIMLLQ